MKLKCYHPLSSFAFKFNLRRYSKAEREYDLNRAAELKVGWCRLNLSNPRCKRLELSVLELKYDEPLSNFAFKFNLCRYIEYGSLMTLQRSLEEAEAAAHAHMGGLLRDEVTESDICDIISKWTGIPVSKLQEGEREKLLNLPEAWGMGGECLAPVSHCTVQFKRT